MSTEPDKPLRLIKGGKSAAPGRSAQHRTGRRTVKRRTPKRTDPMTEALRTLDAEPPEPSTVDKPARPRRRRRAPAPPARRVPPSRTTLVLLVALCLALAGALFAGHRWYADGALERSHQKALAAARQVTVDFVSVSAASVDRDLRRIVAGSSGDFQEEFTRGQAQVRAAVVENNVDSRGTVLRAALLSGDTRHAVVLVAMDATVRNTKAPEGRVSHYRIQVEVDRDPQTDRWSVSKLQFVG
jgi:Mce-associated membrane protein